MRKRAAVFAFSMLACVLLSGCAAPGDPTPPQSLVPVAISDLTAHQQGTAVVLDFTLPRRATNRETLNVTPSIEIYRTSLPRGTSPTQKTEWRMADTIPGERVDAYLKGEKIEFRDPLTPEDFGGGSDVAYKVRTRASKRRASDDSNVVTAILLPPPAVPNDVHALVTETAIVLSWAAAAPSAGTVSGYHVYRATLRGATLSAGEANPQGDISKLAWELAGSTASPEFRDTKFEFGLTYVYIVRTAVGVSPNSTENGIESDDSAPVTIVARDTFPPAIPTGVEAALIPATPQAPAYVELSWAIGSEADLAGYRVYRGGQADAIRERISNEIVSSPAFRDMTVLAGMRYIYRVSAVDRDGNESPQSEPVEMNVPAAGQ